MDIILSIITLFLGILVGFFIKNKKITTENQNILAEAKKEAKIIENEANNIYSEAINNRKEAQFIRERTEFSLLEAESIKSEAEIVKQNKILQAKEKFLELRTAHEKIINDKNIKLLNFENKTKQGENILLQRKEELQYKQKEIEVFKKEVEDNRKNVDAIRENLNNQIKVVEQKNIDLTTIYQEQFAKLEELAGITKDEAKNQLVETIKNEAKTESMSYINDVIEEAKITAKREAKKIVIQSIQRVATEQAVENSVTVFHLESEEIKGRIIGREGRNIRALEAATGIEFIVDDTPEAIILSGFDPVRREIARLALYQLVTDGRIHPARIEEIVSKTKLEIEEDIVEEGKRTAIELGIHGLHPELIRIVGKMKYRSSYGQNLLQHSRETANLCAIMAAELGLNVKSAKRAGLLHDIGKVPDDAPEQPHAILGMQLAEKFKEKADVCNAIGSHHDEIEMTSFIAPIVQVCDAISGSRPGARREIEESYIKRLKDLEKVALSHHGVLKTYAIQAGRELRVIVNSEKISDKETEILSYEIARKIQNEMTYPGQVKITVIRETRAITYAK